MKTDKINKKAPRKRVKLSEINELAMSVIIIKRNNTDKLLQFIELQNAKVLSVIRGIGVSRSTIFESLKIGTDDVSVVFTTCRVEDVREFMQKVTEEFSLNIPGNGKGFTIDVDGYLGAKAIFL